LSQKSVLRFVFFLIWFAIVPAALAVATVVALSPSGTGGTGAFMQLRELAKDQPVPAIIVLFTLFEMVLYSLRDRLPLAGLAGYAGPTGLPAALRSEYEQANTLVGETRRLMHKRRRAIQHHLSPAVTEQLEAAILALEESMVKSPFVAEEFHDCHDQASALVAQHLDRWQKSDIREYTESILVAVAVALLLRAFVVEAFKIPSGSMLPTLQLQDHIFVNKLVYGPTIPFTKNRLYNGLPPSRGDVMVFEYPDPEVSPRPDYIKRVIALPGDTLEVTGGHPILNGWKVPSCSAGHYAYEEGEGVTKQGELFVEFLGEYSYLTLFEDNHPDIEQGPYHVAPGEVWVMGDNRNNSSDSRAWNHGLGAGAPFENIKGKALFVWLSFGSDGWPTLDRLFTGVMGRPRLPKGAPAELVAGIERCLGQRPSVTNPPAPTR
jgi:signal peptidase I